MSSLSAFRSWRIAASTRPRQKFRLRAWTHFGVTVVGPAMRFQKKAARCVDTAAAASLPAPAKSRIRAGAVPSYGRSLMSLETSTAHAN